MYANCTDASEIPEVNTGDIMKIPLISHLLSENIFYQFKQPDKKWRLQKKIT